MAERVWSVRDALDWTVEYLDRKGIAQPRLSAEWLLSAATGLSRVELYAFHERPLSAEERDLLRAGVKRRAAGEPLQYVTGEMPFRHIVMRVRPGVFIPRPETEVLVDVALEMLHGVEEPIIVDLCTGTGVVACSIAHEVPAARVWAVDISSDAVELARENVAALGLTDRVTVLHGDLFGALPEEMRGRIDLVVANPPYIPSADLANLPREVSVHEPVLALDGGPDGLDVARRIMREAGDMSVPEGGILMELDETRVEDAVKALREWYQECSAVRDLAGRDRVVAGRIPRTVARASD